MKLQTKIMDLLYPRRCLFCDRVIGLSDCKKCKTALPTLCRPCKISLQPQGREMDWLAGAYAPYHYDGPVREAVLRLKEGQTHGSIPQFAKKMAAELPAEKFDIVLWVPPFPHSAYGRSANVPRKLADALSDILTVPLGFSVLAKTRDTLPQKELSAQQRRKNVLGAFVVQRPEIIYKAHVLLVDDVFTTGSTVNECARVLRAAGAEKCTVVTLAATMF